MTERKCRVCGCTKDNCSQCIEKTGEPCHWVEYDLCSACRESSKEETMEILRDVMEDNGMKLMKYMTEPELKKHLDHQLRFIKSCETPDTIGSMLVIFQDDRMCQYGATVDPETAPQALRELADRIERRETVKRE